ncbi:MAG: alanine--tRNA ligase [Armatimonadota bacterium]
MRSEQIKESFLRFFEKHGHKVIEGASLVPENDPSVLFTTAGMHPLVPYLLGEPHPMGRRLANCQRCVRTDDIEEVGDTSHLTFFEMLGNWSLGDYFKEEAIRMSYEYMTEWLHLDPNRLWVSVFAGDEDAPRDEEAAAIWRSIGIPEERICYFGKKQNWWGPAGQTGPCGPDTEMFIDTGRPPCSPSCNPSCSCGKYIELWNDVFMQYNKTARGTYEPLEQRNVDTGFGLERGAMLLQGKDSVFETDLFQPIMAAIAGFAKTNDLTSQRIVADHLRAATFLIADGVPPSNVERGYVVRRLIRRSVRHGRRLGITQPFVAAVAEAVIGRYKADYPHLERERHRILEELRGEEAKFGRTLERGLREFERVVAESDGRISGEQAFHLYDTFGFPIELTIELAAEKGLTVDREGYHEHFRRHQEMSRAGAEQKFKGGLADHSEQTTKLHTATHLLHQALRDVLGPHVQQKGSNITAERLRFDFSHPQRLTPEEIEQVERIVNEKIAADLPVSMEITTVEDAKARGALALFTDRYGEQVKLYKIGDYSLEVCGGPHVERTGVIGRFRIVKEEASGAGVRRIRAVVE